MLCLHYLALGDIKRQRKTHLCVPQGGREYLREAKAAAAILGGVDAMVALVRRINKRYQDLVSQGCVRAVPGLSGHTSITLYFLLIPVSFAHLLPTILHYLHYSPILTIAGCASPYITCYSLHYMLVLFPTSHAGASLLHHTLELFSKSHQMLVLYHMLVLCLTLLAGAVP